MGKKFRVGLESLMKYERDQERQKRMKVIADADEGLFVIRERK